MKANSAQHEAFPKFALMGNEGFFAEFDALSKEAWLEKIENDLKGKKPEELHKKWQDLEFVPFTDRTDLEQSSYSFRDRGDWHVRQAFCFDPKENTNKRILHALNEGVNNLELAGVASEDQLKEALKGVNPEYIRTDLKLDNWLNDGGLEAFESWAHKKSIEGSWNYDPLNMLLSSGKFYRSQQEDMAFIDILRSSTLNEFQWIEVDTATIHDQGAYASTEMAIGLAMFNEYLGNLEQTKTEAGKINFSIGLGVNYFLELAKVRSFRRLLHSVSREYGFEGEFFIHARTGIWNYASYDRHNNLLRSCTEAMSGVIGGANAISILPFDITLKEDHHFASHLARMQQQMLAEESFMNKVMDPVSGSYFIETVSSELEEKAWSKFQTIEREGGFIKACHSGSIRAMIEADRKAQKVALETDDLSILGLNLYPNKDERLATKIEDSSERLGSEIEKRRENG